jgi:hypothetical protein
MVPPKDAFIRVLIHPRKYFISKLLGGGSFGGFIGHLVHRQATFHVSSSRIDPISMVRIIAFTFLGCWALIIPTLITCFSQDDHLILLDAMAHVETDNSPF